MIGWVKNGQAAVGARLNTIYQVLTQPRPRGGIAREDAGCEPDLNKIDR
jgi:hypothetical protein